MSRLQLFNGQFFKENEQLLPVSNRGFCYGDGFFESMRISNDRLLFANEHWNRLNRASSFLGITIPEILNTKSFERYAIELAATNGFSNARIRFQGFRMGEGRYTPENNLLGWSMVCQELDSSTYVLNTVGLKLGFCNTHRINPAPQSSFKSSNSLPYILGGMFAQRHCLDDCLLLDTQGHVAEATGSNIVLIKGNLLSTPDLKNGGVPGVMRSVVIREAEALGLHAKESPISTSDVLAADELFLTNAARGIQWVGAIEKKRYFKKVGGMVLDHINQKYLEFN